MRYRQSIVSIISIAVLHLLFFTLLSNSTLAQYQLRKPTGGQTPASITVTDPSGGATWDKGKRYTIKWVSTGLRGSVKIVLESAQGKATTVAASTLNNGSYNWTVAASTTDGTYKLVVMSTDGKTRGESAGNITIQKRTMGGLQPQSLTTQSRPQVGTNNEPTESVTTQPQISVTQQPAGVHEQELPQAETNVGQLNPSITPTGTVGNVSGLLHPDLVITRIENWTRNWPGRPSSVAVLQITIGNNGTDFSGDILISGRNDLQPMFAETFREVNIPAGADTLVQLPTGVWPAHDSPCGIHCEVYLDQNNEITELDETNNDYNGTLYRWREPHIQVPSNIVFLGDGHNDRLRMDMSNEDIGVMCKDDVVSFSRADHEIVTVASTEIQNCGPTAGTFTIRYWEDYHGDGSNVDRLVGEVTDVHLETGQIMPLVTTLTLDSGPPFWGDERFFIRIKITAELSGGDYDDPFFVHGLEICKQFWD